MNPALLTDQILNNSALSAEEKTHETINSDGYFH